MLDTVSPLSGALAPDPSADAGTSANAPGAAAGLAEAGADFGSFLGQLISGAAGAVKAGEATALAGIEGKASTQQVVEAMMTAEQSLQAAIAVRDKVVSAILEITRMSI